ncbi:MAG TPA: dihydrolipoyl dehydrogenase [bacterium]|nr:dihydrolipoyl dehydrogenase [bacterium]
MQEYDVMVIGAGGGMKVALPVADMGKSVVLIEKDRLGGTCLNRGCIPSKMLIYPADFARECREAARLDLDVGFRDVRFRELIDRIASTVDGIAAGLRRQIDEHPRLDLVRGRAVFTGPREVEVGGERIRAERVFIVAGSRPRIPPVPGLEETPYWTSPEALRAPGLPRRLVVVGGGFIACELGNAYSSFGSRVDFIAPDGLIDRQDDDVRAEFKRIFTRFNTVREGARLERVEYRAGTFVSRVRAPGASEEILESDSLLVAAGVVPDIADLHLERTGVELDERGFIAVDGFLRTRAPGVYAFGDCIGDYLFRHSVNFEGEYLVRTVFGGDDRPIRYYPVPSALFSWPEVAGVGKSEKELRAEGVEYVAGKAMYAESNAGLARQVDHGFVKILVARSDRRILGAQIVGPEASDMIHILIGMMYMQAGLDDLNRMIYIHPALPELVRDAARAAEAALA